MSDMTFLILILVKECQLSSLFRKLGSIYLGIHSTYVCP